jgi:hypothetical protein
LGALRHTIYSDRKTDLSVSSNTVTMADFTGMTVQLTLKNPPNLVIRGKVMNVVAGQTLSLQDGKDK